MNKHSWYLIETAQEYEKCVARYEEIKSAAKGSEDHKEKLLLIHFISQYENDQWDLPDLDPIELIKIRMEEFGYKPADLAKEYGDKGTVSKVLNYRQALSLSMIRKFSDLLGLPVESLIKEYDLKSKSTIST